MADEITAPGNRRLPRWARVLLCVALVPVIILEPLVVIGLWPGLNFDRTITKVTPASSGFGIERTSSPLGIDMLEVRFGVASVHWARHAPTKNAFYSPGFGSKDWDHVMTPFREVYWHSERQHVSISRMRP